jgi:hypothetical protein
MMTNEVYASIWLAIAAVFFLARLVIKDEEMFAWIRFCLLMSALFALHK